jgi:pimeloyl-ACP methyl ester carboxylesterase
MTGANGTSAADGFTARLKAALVGDPGARFVYLNNFEVEREWGRNEPGLPGTGLSFSSATVNRMEEVGVLLADDLDVVVLKAPVDAAYAAYLHSLGTMAGRRLIVDHNEPKRSVTADALASPRLLAELSALADGRTYLMPLGISPDEERLADAVGIPLAGPSAATCKRVNGKIFSREIVDVSGLTPVPGIACRTLEELKAALDAYLTDDRGTRVVVKESLGVSGRGMVLLNSPRQGAHLVRMLARRGADSAVPVVVERWIDKECDLNYQFIVGRDGQVLFQTVKTALTENGVHRGHLFPPALRLDQAGQLNAAADVIGNALAREGYYGLVGVDAMLGVDGTLYPCLEINARFNMATYQNRIAERLIRPGQYALATVFNLRLTRAHSFDEVCSALGGLLFRGWPADGSGPPSVLINNFATLNAAVVGGRDSCGRIYGICVGDSAEDVKDVRTAAQAALTGMAAAA